MGRRLDMVGGVDGTQRSRLDEGREAWSMLFELIERFEVTSRLRKKMREGDSSCVSYRMYSSSISLQQQQPPGGGGGPAPADGRAAQAAGPVRARRTIHTLLAKRCRHGTRPQQALPRPPRTLSSVFGAWQPPAYVLPPSVLHESADPVRRAGPLIGL